MTLSPAVAEARSVVVKVTGYFSLGGRELNPQTPDWEPYSVDIVRLEAVAPETLAGQEWFPHYCGGGFDIEFAHKVWELGKQYQISRDELEVAKGGCLPMVDPVELR